MFQDYQYFMISNLNQRKMQSKQIQKVSPLSVMRHATLIKFILNRVKTFIEKNVGK